MKIASLRLWAPLLVLGFPSIVSAAVVTAIVSGPGGGGTAVSLSPFIANISYQKITFTSIDYIDISLTVDSAGTYNFHQYPSTVVATVYGANTKNLTGTDWGKLQIFNLDADASSITNVQTIGSVQNITFDNDSALIYGSPVVVPANGSLGVNIQLTVNGAGTYTLREIPVAVPEATTLALVGESLLLGGGTWFFRRRLAR